MTRSESKRVEGKGQTVDYTEHVILQGFRGKPHTLRVLIHVDSYVDQAWGRVERHDGTKWHEVASVKGCSLKIDLKIGYARQSSVPVEAFQADRNFLIALAEEVL